MISTPTTEPLALMTVLILAFVPLPVIVTNGACIYPDPAVSITTSTIFPSTITGVKEAVIAEPVLIKRNSFSASTT